MRIVGSAATPPRYSAPGNVSRARMRSRNSAVGRPGLTPGMKPAVLLEVVGLVDRVEGDRRVEVREEDDEDRLADHVGRLLGMKKSRSLCPGRVDELADRRREGHDRRGEDHRDHAGHVHAQRQVGLAACVIRRPITRWRTGPGSRRWPSWTNTIAGDHGERDERHHHLEDLVGVRPPRLDAVGQARTIEAKIISEMPLPMPRWVISSPIHITRIVPRGERDGDGSARR